MTKANKYTAEYVRDISEQVYRRKLDSECGEGTAKRVDDDIASGVNGPDGRPIVSIRNRAAAFNKLTRIYLEVLGALDDWAA
jgi:hypothetical protein